MRTNKAALIVAIATLCSQYSLAADLPSRKSPSPVIVPISTSHIWTGCHVGLNIGGGWGQTQWKDSVVNTALQQGDIDGNNLGGVATTNMTGGVLGGQIGCDYQFANNWVVGVNGAFSGSTISGDNTDQFNRDWPLHSNVDWYGGVTGRLGYSPVSNLLIYARGGFAFADQRAQVINAGFVIGSGALPLRTGWTAGGGVEWAFAPNWSVFVEGNYYDFGTQENWFSGNLISGQPPFGARMKTTLETVTVGVNYHINWAPRTVFAKY